MFDEICCHEAGVSGYTEGRGKRHWCLPAWSPRSVAGGKASSCRILKASYLNLNIEYIDVL